MAAAIVSMVWSSTAPWRRRSRSAELGGRNAIIASAEERLLAELESRSVEVRQGTLEGRTETDLSEAMTAALSGVPRARLSAIFVVTDGQLTDVPGGASLGLDIPVHAYLAGDPEDQRDRRVQILRAPRYGVVGEEAEIAFTVLDEGASDLDELPLPRTQVTNQGRQRSQCQTNIPPEGNSPTIQYQRALIKIVASIILDNALLLIFIVKIIVWIRIFKIRIT